MKPITKEILEKLYYDVLSERNGLNEVDYQKEWLTNPETYSHNNNVLAQAPASGKTNTILIYLEISNRLGLLENPTLIFPAAETLLKMNMEKSLIEFKPSFTFMVINTKDDIVKAKNDNIDVIISLPQMFTERNVKNFKLLPKHIGLLITDEAHIWFLKNTIKNFIKTKKITKFVELTGSPYLFNLRNQIAKQNGKNEPYRMFYVTTNDLLDRGRISNVKLKMITTPAYNFTHKSFIGNYGNLKQGLTNSKKKNRHLLKDVLNELLKKCNYNCEIPYLQNKNNIGIISRAWHGVANMIDNFGQTMICCDSQAMADEFYKTFIENDSIKDKVLLSHSKNDPKSENFELFEKNPNQYKILIVVDRGQLGYNYLELFNIIDFTFSTNLTTIHQRLNRVTRKSVLNPDKDKIFFKVSTNELEGYYKIIMSAVLCLNERNWYENYNTKNLGQLPLTLIKKRKRNSKSNPTKQKKNNKVRLQNFDDLEILDFQSFNGVLHNPDGAYEVYSQITLDDARREFFNINQDCLKKGWTEEKLIEIAKKYKTIVSLRKNEKGIYAAIRRMGIEDKAFAHMERLWSQKTKEDFYQFIKENNIKTKSDLWNKGGQWFRVAKRYNINIEKLFPNKYNKDWNETNIRKAAKKYNDLTTFYKELPSAYFNAKKLGILDDISKNWTKPKRNTPYTKADIPELTKQIKNAKSRNEARNILKSRKSYDLLNKFGIINKLFPSRIKAK